MNDVTQLRVNLINCAIPVRIRRETDGYKTDIELPQDVLALPADRQMALCLALEEHFQKLRALNETRRGAPGISLSKPLTLSVGARITRHPGNEWKAKFNIGFPVQWAHIERTVISDVLLALESHLRGMVVTIGNYTLTGANARQVG